MEEKVRQLFRENNGILRTSALKSEGIYWQSLNKMLEAGEIEQIRRGYYRLIDLDSYSDVPLIRALYPDAVICMESALNYYGYTDRSPSKWHLAVDSKSTRTRFKTELHQIQPHFLLFERYSAGITEGKIDGTSVLVYDREKTVCDIILHRNRIDAEVFNSAIRNYLQDPLKNPAQLMRYAKLLHIERKVRELLSIWL